MVRRLARVSPLEPSEDSPGSLSARARCRHLPLLHRLPVCAGRRLGLVSRRWLAYRDGGAPPQAFPCIIALPRQNFRRLETWISLDSQRFCGLWAFLPLPGGGWWRFTCLTAFVRVRYSPSVVPADSKPGVTTRRCALSGLPDQRLLDAAHIISDKDERLGQPIVSNGLLLSKIHHAAFDAHLIGIDPDYRSHVSARLLGQHDGPMLEALKQLNGGTIHLPARAKDHPDRNRLALRFERFKAAA